MAMRKPLPIGFSPEERKELDEAAQHAGMTTGTWLRATGLEVARRNREARAAINAAQ